MRNWYQVALREAWDIWINKWHRQIFFSFLFLFFAWTAKPQTAEKSAQHNGHVVVAAWYETVVTQKHWTPKVQKVWLGLLFTENKTEIIFKPQGKSTEWYDWVFSPSQEDCVLDAQSPGMTLRVAGRIMARCCSCCYLRHTPELLSNPHPSTEAESLPPRSHPLLSQLKSPGIDLLGMLWAPEQWDFICVLFSVCVADLREWDLYILKQRSVFSEMKRDFSINMTMHCIFEQSARKWMRSALSF